MLHRRTMRHGDAKRLAGWSAGDRPMTDVQREALRRLSEAANVPMDDTLPMDEAAGRIAELQAITGRSDELGAANVVHSHAPREHDRRTGVSVLAGGHHVRSDTIEDDDETPLVRDRPVKRSADAGDLS